MGLGASSNVRLELRELERAKCSQRNITDEGRELTVAFTVLRMSTSCSHILARNS